MRIEVRFSGVGGQGVVTASRVLAEAAGVRQGLYVCQTQFYGYAIRGGPSTGNVIISDAEIGYPWIISPDIFVALDQSAMDSGHSAVKDDGLIIADTVYVPKIPRTSVRVLHLPLTDIADKAGSRRSLNAVALGALTKFTNIVQFRHLEEALLTHVPPKAAEINRNALQMGYEDALV